jgi:hypothetical protein
VKERREATAKKFRPETKLARPPTIPNVPGITWIGTIGDLLAEGRSMNNCVMDYAQRGIDGEMYFFHLEKDGDSATTVIANDGAYQCEGRNRKANAATKWKWWD